MAYQSEIEKLEQRYEENPKQWFAALADAYRKEGRLDLALEYVRGGLEMRPNYASGHIVLGRCLLEKREYEEASQAFEQVLELDAENIIALKSLSEISEEKGDLGGARHWLTRLLEIDPMNDEAVQSLERLDKLPPPAEAPPPEAEEAEAEEPAGPVLEPGAAWAREAMAPPPAPPAPQAGSEEAAWVPGEEPVLPDEASAGADTSDFVIERYSGENVFGFEPTSIEAPNEAEAAVEEGAATPTPSGEEAGATPPVDDSASVGEPAAGPPAVTVDDETTAKVPAVEIEALGTQDRADAQLRDDEVAAAEEAQAAVGEQPEAEAPPAGPAPPEPAPEEEGLAVMSFDEELGWDAGERLPHSITANDIQEAEARHEELAAPVEFLGDPEAVEARRSGAEAAAPRVELPEEAGPSEPAEILEPAGAEPEPQPPSLEPAAASSVEADTALPIETVPEEAGIAGESGTVEREEAVPVGAAPAERVEEPSPDADTEGRAWSEGGSDASDAESVDLPLIMPDDEAPAVVGPVEPEPVVTETMAEVFADQGLFEQARQTYDRLLEQHPGDPELERRRNEVADRAKVAAVAKQVSSYSVAATGGPSVVAYLQGVFDGASEDQIFGGAEATDMSPGEGEPGAPQAEAEPSRISALESAFGGENREPLGAPTRPAGDEVSLRSVFGGERPPLPPRAESGAESEPSGPQGGVSFDEFYGKPKSQPSEEGQSDAEGPDGKDEDFKNWLEGLKT